MYLSLSRDILNHQLPSLSPVLFTLLFQKHLNKISKKLTKITINRLLDTPWVELNHFPLHQLFLLNMIEVTI